MADDPPLPRNEISRFIDITVGCQKRVDATIDGVADHLRKQSDELKRINREQMSMRKTLNNFRSELRRRPDV